MGIKNMKCENYTNNVQINSQFTFKQLLCFRAQLGVIVQYKYIFQQKCYTYLHFVVSKSTIVRVFSKRKKIVVKLADTIFQTVRPFAGVTDKIHAFSRKKRQSFELIKNLESLRRFHASNQNIFPLISSVFETFFHQDLTILHLA